jgi:molybdopterin-binding protein
MYRLQGWRDQQPIILMYAARGDTFAAARRGSGMELSARNQFKGRVTSVNQGGVVAEVTVDIGNGQEIVSVITNGSVERLNLKVGSEVTAIIKATEVILAG